jgi:hypothetical protein
MVIPLETTGDILNLVLALGFFLITLFLLPVLFRLFRLLGVAREIAENIRGIVDLVEGYLWQPVRLVTGVIDKVKRFFGKKK